MGIGAELDWPICRKRLFRAMRPACGSQNFVVVVAHLIVGWKANLDQLFVAFNLDRRLQCDYPLQGLDCFLGQRVIVHHLAQSYSWTPLPLIVRDPM